MHVYFCTTNSQKYAKGNAICKPAGITLEQKALDIDEVQSENAEYVAIRKAEAAYAQLQVPTLISDDSWSIEGLNGFPGTYAKSVNHWFTAEDYIRVTKDLANRRVSITQYLVYYDGAETKIFEHTTMGVLLDQPSGTVGASIQKIVSLSTDKKTSISDLIDENGYADISETLQVWQDFADWYVQQ